jgi:hypothetical protein
MRTIRLLSGAVLLTAACSTWAADALKSGPQKGELIPASFHPFNVTGDRAGRYHCVICQQGLSPTVLIFAHELPEKDQPFAAFLKKLDVVVQKNLDYRLMGAVVFLTETKDDERAGFVKKVEEFAKELEIKHLILAVDSVPGPEAYKLSADADITVLPYFRHRITANFAFPKDKMTDKDMEAMMAEVVKLVPQKKK